MSTYFSHFSDETLAKPRLIALDRQLEEKLESICGSDDFYDELLAADKTKQSSLGQFHTQENVVDIVLGSLPADWVTRLLEGATLIDPSCGTGNFLIAVIKKVHKQLAATHSDVDTFKIINKKVIPNLAGAEIDPVLVKAAKLNISRAFSGKVSVPDIAVLDSLDLLEEKAVKKYGNSFDFVVGNPPWVEVKRLPDAIKNAVQDKFLVSNLYGAFILQGSAFLRDGGHLSYVVPRSFTGGRYYFKLREFLKIETSLKKVSYFTNRNQEFHGGDVLQELVVICFARLAPGKDHKVVCKPCNDLEDFSTQSSFQVKQADLFSHHDLMMLLAASKDEFHWIRRISSFRNFEEQGFIFSTGQLVLHRSKDFLRSEPETGAHRILYGHDILNQDGKYTFQVKVESVKGRFPYAVCEGKKNRDGRRGTTVIEDVSSIESYCNRYPEVIICRRRSHKGDKRRFVGVYIKEELPDGFFLENGLNFLAVDSSKRRKDAPTLLAFYKILRSDLFERYFNIVSSNTQLNKNDMYLFGLPDVDERTKPIYSLIERIDDNDAEKLNPLIEKLYEAGLA